MLQRSTRLASRFYKLIDILYMSEVAFNAICGEEAQERKVLYNVFTEDAVI